MIVVNISIDKVEIQTKVDGEFHMITCKAGVIDVNGKKVIRRFENDQKLQRQIIEKIGVFQNAMFDGKASIVFYGARFKVAPTATSSKLRSWTETIGSIIAVGASAPLLWGKDKLLTYDKECVSENLKLTKVTKTRVETLCEENSKIASCLTAIVRIGDTFPHSETFVATTTSRLKPRCSFNRLRKLLDDKNKKPLSIYRSCKAIANLAATHIS